MAFEQRPDSGRLMAAQSKRSEKAPDYWGELAINIKDLTNAQVEQGFVTFKLSGWKKQSKSGVTYLSLAVDRRVPQEETRKPAQRQDDDDVPF
jgi:hypothetical protein